jgi:asparagine N-glycosylation enzyme membrane subunit Stt3
LVALSCSISSNIISFSTISFPTIFTNEQSVSFTSFFFFLFVALAGCFLAFDVLLDLSSSSFLLRLLLLLLLFIYLIIVGSGEQPPGSGRRAGRNGAA